MNEERIPSLRIRDWTLRTFHLPLEQRGLLISVLFWDWQYQEPLRDIHTVAHAIGVHPGKFVRLWTPELHRLYERMRVGRRPIDAFTRAKVYKRSGGKCQNCQIVISEDSFHADHIKPVAAGGRSNIGNLQALCAPCNLRKGMAHV